MDKFWEAFDRFKEKLGDTFHPILSPIFDILEIPFESFPLASARYFAIGLFLICGAWALTLKADYIYEGAIDRAKWRDLRIWTCLILIPYIWTYWVM